MKKFELYNGDCLDVLKTLPDNSVDSVVTDPPYGLSIMGKKWDYDVPSIEIWEECLRVLKPGGYLLAFAGTRTQHRMAVRIEDAGFEIRDMIAWVYGSGFPKSLNISKAIDKSAGAEREVISEVKTNSGGMAHLNKVNAEQGFRPTAYSGHSLDEKSKNVFQISAPSTDEAKQWDGWGTALKPALEPITMARKPLEKGTIAANVLEYGTGGINIDGCRVALTNDISGWSRTGSKESDNIRVYCFPNTRDPVPDNINGRFPANFIHDGSEEVVELFPNTKSGKDKNPTKEGVKGFFGEDMGYYSSEANYGDSVNASRFFYCPKTSKTDRSVGNNHPTVKPTELMKYLCRLVTPPNGIVLDPFMGSGSTGKAAMIERFRFIGIEREQEYFEIAKARIEAATISTPVKVKKAEIVPIIQEENPLDKFFEE